MLPELIDYGNELVTLVALGPPETVPLPDTAGNAALTYRISDSWQLVYSLAFLFTADATIATRAPVVSFENDPGAPFSQVVAPFSRAAGGASRFTFAHDVQQAGANNAAAIVAPMPLYLLTPGEALAVTVTGGVAGDHLTRGQLRRQRYVPRGYGNLFPGGG